MGSTRILDHRRDGGKPLQADPHAARHRCARDADDGGHGDRVRTSGGKKGVLVTNRLKFDSTEAIEGAHSFSNIVKDAMVPSQASGSRSPYTLVQRTSSHSRSERTRADIIDAACNSSRRGEQRVASLQALSANAYWGALNIPQDITRIANQMAESSLPEAIKRRLVRIAGDSVRQATTSNTSVELAREIAHARAMRGTPCSEVEEDHGFWLRHPTRELSLATVFQLWRTRLELEMSIVHGPAGARVMRGESCDTVASEHGLTCDEAVLALEMKAVGTVGSGMVLRGATFEQTALALGIHCIEARVELHRLVETCQTEGAGLSGEPSRE